MKLEKLESVACGSPESHQMMKKKAFGVFEKAFVGFEGGVAEGYEIFVVEFEGGSSVP